jgi:hypothetical protein
MNVLVVFDHPRRDSFTGDSGHHGVSTCPISRVIFAVVQIRQN